MLVVPNGYGSVKGRPSLRTPTGVICPPQRSVAVGVLSCALAEHALASVLTVMLLGQKMARSEHQSAMRWSIEDDVFR